MNQLLCFVTVEVGTRAMQSCPHVSDTNVGLRMKGAALSAHLYWSSVALSGFLSGDLSSCSTLICKPGSGRFEGQTLLSSVRQKTKKRSTQVRVLNSTFWIRCVWLDMSTVSRKKQREDKKKNKTTKD